MDGPLSLATGTVLGGDFRLLRPLGAGGMGVVYVAEQLSTGKRRALKVMHPHILSDERSRARFAQEARVGALIQSQHVVEVVGAGIDEATGAPWIAMELLEGKDLADYARSRAVFNPHELHELLRQLCHALGAAHDAGVIHRDVKPENIFVARGQSATARTFIKVLDFGIAKVAAQAKTTATARLGSPAWMAPEQTDPRAKLGPAADVWAIGLVSFWLLTGRMYWRTAADPEVSMHALMKEVLFSPIVSGSRRARELGVGRRWPAALDGWLACCLDRDPEARLASAHEVLDGFVAVLGEVERAGASDDAADEGEAPQSVAHGATLDAGSLEALPTQDSGPAAIVVDSGGLAAPDDPLPPPSSRRAVTPGPLPTGAALVSDTPAASAGSRPWLVGAGLLAAVALGVLLGRGEPPAAPLARLPVLAPVITLAPVPPPETAPDPPPSATAVPTGPTTVAPRPPPAALAPFDHVWAQRALSRIADMADHQCRGRPGSPTSVTVEVTFSPNGSVAIAREVVSGQRSPASMCATGLFWGARVPAFSGEALPMTASVVVPGR
ncbi:MAG: serine/threonine protein kinase [Myxococcales bacterium]|nr:serine/threonine protein kinase [Myxococcales bacterium]